MRRRGREVTSAARAAGTGAGAAGGGPADRTSGPAGEGGTRERASGGRAPSARPRRLPTAAYPDWEAIYEDNVGRIHRLMFTKVGNRADSEDLTSQVFLAALPSLRPAATVGEVRAYLLATARTVLASHWQRTLGRQVTVIDVDRVDLEDFAQPGPAASGEGGPSRAPERIARILDALPERHRTILTLRFLLGYSIREAAAEMDISLANARVLQHRALRRAAGLEPPGPDPGGRAGGGSPDRAMDDGADGADGTDQGGRT